MQRKAVCVCAPAELAIGDAFDPHLALHPYDVPDRLVLDHPELLLRRLPVVQLFALLQELRGALQRADVVRAERRVQLRGSRHRVRSFSSSKSRDRGSGGESKRFRTESRSQRDRMEVYGPRLTPTPAPAAASLIYHQTKRRVYRLAAGAFRRPWTVCILITRIRSGRGRREGIHGIRRVYENAILLSDGRRRSTDRAVGGHVTGEWCSGKQRHIPMRVGARGPRRGFGR